MEELRLQAGLRHRAGTFDRIPAYRIPRGDWFEWVTCPHYLAEIVSFCVPASWFCSL